MGLVQTRRPLLHWDRFVLRFDLDAVQQVVNQQLAARRTVLREVTIHADGDGLLLRGTASLKGLPASLTARVEELKLYRRFLGCRVTGVRGPFSVPIPLALVERVISALDSPLIQFDKEDGVLTVDLRDTLPPGLDLSVSDIRCSGRELEMTLTHGSWTPTTRDLLLPADLTSIEEP